MRWHADKMATFVAAPKIADHRAAVRLLERFDPYTPPALYGIRPRKPSVFQVTPVSGRRLTIRCRVTFLVNLATNRGALHARQASGVSGPFMALP